VGCNILLHAIPPEARIYIIANGKSSRRNAVRRQYDRIRPLASLDADQRGWALDVLNAVQSLDKTEFSLVEIYEAESHLANLHPANKHVREKIRQQLQVLRNLGLIDFLQRGHYRLRHVSS
jgi:type II restriction enzyme